MNNQRTLFIIEDDLPLLESLCAMLSKRGFQTQGASNMESAYAITEKTSFDCYLLDLNVLNESSLSIIPKLKAKNPAATIVIMTGYASIATAVEAIKLGASNYLPKPLALGDVLDALNESSKKENESVKIDTPTEAPESRDFRRLSVKRLEWEHIQNTLKANNGNVSETARQLNMHRRTLQRKLQKKPGQ